MAKRDLYGMLGVGSNATADEIKKAFRARAKEAHPDVAGGSPRQFAEIKKAELILLDRGEATPAAIDPQAAAADGASQRPI